MESVKPPTCVVGRIGGQVATCLEDGKVPSLSLGRVNLAN